MKRVFSLVVLVAVTLTIIGGCRTVQNNKMKDVAKNNIETKKL